MKKYTVLFAILSILLSSCLDPLDFSDYHDPQRVDDALTTLHNNYPSLTKIVTIGTSIGGLPIKALEISSTPNVDDPKKADVVFVGCHHAREWMSVEVPLYNAVHLLSDYSSDPTVKADLDHCQIWIIPVLNADGFQYTQTAANRYWRKNRRNNGDGTFGVDLNRNYSYQWKYPGDSGSGVTSDDAYSGPSPFSEPEITALRDFMAGLGNLKAFFSYHSFGEWHMKPWSYTSADAPGQPTLHSIATRDIARMAAVHGVSYREIFTLYNSSGEMTDYWWNQQRLAGLTTELRPYYDGQLSSFAPDKSQIIPTCEENYVATKAIIHDAAMPRVWIKDNSGDTGEEPSTGYPWESPDIYTVPSVLVENATVDLHIHVNNSTGTTVNGVTVDAYYTDPRITLEFPNPEDKLIASASVNVLPGGSDITMHWVVPSGTNSWGERHWCVGVVIKQADDMPLTTIVNRSSNIACHNFNTVALISGQSLIFAATNFMDNPAELNIQSIREGLPPGWRVEIPPVKDLQSLAKILPSTERKSRLLNTQGVLLEPGQTIQIPVKVYFDKPSDKEVQIRIAGSLIPLVSGKRTVVGNGYTYNVTTKRS
jgi:hypothetical protein